MRKILLLAVIGFAGCTIPAELFFRNYSDHIVRLQATLNDRRYFDKLPNKVTLYDTVTKKKQYYGNWRGSKLVTWTDSISFSIDIPAYTVISLEDLSNNLTLGAGSPDVVLKLISGNDTTTLFTGDYSSIVDNFQSRRYGSFRPAIYYYDYR